MWFNNLKFYFKQLFLNQWKFVTVLMVTILCQLSGFTFLYLELRNTPKYTLWEIQNEYYNRQNRFSSKLEIIAKANEESLVSYSELWGTFNDMYELLNKSGFFTRMNNNTFQWYSRTYRRLNCYNNEKLLRDIVGIMPEGK